MTLESSQPAPPPQHAQHEPAALDYASPLPEPPELPAIVRLRRVSVVAVGMVAGIFVANWSRVDWGDGMDYALMAALPLALIGPLRRRIVAAFDRIRDPSPRARTRIALSIAVLAALLSLAQALRVGRELVPHWHDEHSYMLQAVQLAHFKLWVTPPPDWPLADFFESFHIFTEPVYCSVYWPGASLMNVPGVWLGLPSFVMPLLIYGATIGMVYLLTARLIDGVAGVMAAMLATVVFEYYSFSTRVMAQVPTALLGALLIWSWLRWREAAADRRLRWVAVMGIFAGWLAITRPVDGLAFALPVAIAVIATLLSDHVRIWREAGQRRIWTILLAPPLKTALVGVAFTLPFFSLQITFNYGTTGNALTPPYVQYFERYHPGFKYASAGVVDRRNPPAPQTDLPQKLEYYRQFIARSGGTALTNTAWQELSGWRLPTLLSYAFPGRNFFGFAMVGVAVGLGLFGVMPARQRRLGPPLRVMSAVIACFLAFYVYNPLFLTHYSIMLGVVTLPLAAVGLRAVEECAGTRLRPFLVVLVSGTTFIWFAWTIWDYSSTYHPAVTEVTFSQEDAPRMIRGKALVLVRYTPNSNVHNEPVYNSRVPWPDEARIIWAHELGDPTIKILRYYAQRDPEREIYLMIRPGFELYPMGSARQALETFEAGDWPLPPPEVLNEQLLSASHETRALLRARLPRPLQPPR